MTNVHPDSIAVDHVSAVTHNGPRGPSFALRLMAASDGVPPFELVFGLAGATQLAIDVATWATLDAKRPLILAGTDAAGQLRRFKLAPALALAAGAALVGELAAHVAAEGKVSR